MTPTTIITIPAMAQALRITTDMEVVPSVIAEILARMMVAGLDQMQVYAPTAPATTKAEALTRFVGFFYDTQSTALNNAPQVNAFRMSGAMAMLSPYHVSLGATV